MMAARLCGYESISVVGGAHLIGRNKLDTVGLGVGPGDKLLTVCNFCQAVISTECRGCGHCVSDCPEQAIEISIEYEQFVEKSIARLSRLVDVS